MKNLEMLTALTNKELNRSARSAKGTNDYIIEVLSGGKKLTRIEMVIQISILRYKELTGRELTDAETQKSDFAESWKKVNITVKNSIDTNISKNNREPQYKQYVLKQTDNKYYLELKK